MKWMKFILWGIGYSFALICLIELAWFLIMFFKHLPLILGKPLYIAASFLGFTLSYFVHASEKYKKYKQLREAKENKPKPKEVSPDQF
ncbi:MAG: hypothetical protein WC047_08675 [Kiritimatiellales bacterium]